MVELDFQVVLQNVGRPEQRGAALHVAAAARA